MATLIPIDFFNCLLVKKTGYISSNTTETTSTPFYPVWPSLFFNKKDYVNFPANASTNQINVANRNYYIEENRITGGFNNNTLSIGVRAYINEDNPNQRHRSNSLIFSGLFNSLTGFNETNVFSVGKSITKSTDPYYGSIQKLYVIENDLNILQEAKVSKALVDKDAIYSAEGGGTVTASNAVIGQIIPYLGDFGISRNPESFANYGFRRYFTDKDRASVMRLSRDGLTEISENGMVDFFRDQSNAINDGWKTFQATTTTATGPGSFNQITLDSVANLELGMSLTIDGNKTNVYITNISGNVISISQTISLTSNNVTLTFSKWVKDKIIGAYDVHDDQYTVSYQKAFINPTDTNTFSFEDVPEIGTTSTIGYQERVSGWTSFFTFRPSEMFSAKGNFYSLNNCEVWKHYDEQVINNRGVFYNTSYKSSIEFVINDSPSVKKSFQTINYEGDNGYEINYVKSDIQRVNTSYSLENQDTTPLIYSYDEGSYTDPQTAQPAYAGFNRKENLYVANLINNSSPRQSEVIFGNSISGIKGYFATVKISTDSTTNTGGLKELWSVGSRYVLSS